MAPPSLIDWVELHTSPFSQLGDIPLSGMYWVYNVRLHFLEEILQCFIDFENDWWKPGNKPGSSQWVSSHAILSPGSCGQPVAALAALSVSFSSVGFFVPESSWSILKNCQSGEGINVFVIIDKFRLVRFQGYCVQDSSIGATVDIVNTFYSWSINRGL